MVRGMPMNATDPAEQTSGQVEGTSTDDTNVDNKAGDQKSDEEETNGTDRPGQHHW